MRRTLPFAAAVAALCLAGAGVASAQTATDGYYNGVYYHNGAFYRGLVRPEAPVASRTMEAPAARTVTDTRTAPAAGGSITLAQDTRYTARRDMRAGTSAGDARVTTTTPAPAARAEPVQPRVMGWVAMRPSDCGVYHYWDGGRCLDARDVPPPLRESGTNIGDLPGPPDTQ